MRQHLTELSVRALKPTERQFKVWDTTTRGFGVLVSGKTKSWIVMYGAGRKLKVLGRFPETSLADARKRAKRLLLEPQADPASVSFSEAVDAFLQTQDHLSQRSRGDYARHLRKHFEPVLGRKRLDEIETRPILKILDDLADRPAERKYAHSVIRRFFRWATGRRYLKHSPLEGADTPKAVPTRDRVLADDELKAIWKATETSSTYNSIVRLLLLTGQRRNEIAALRASWIKENEIVFPKEITKNGREHCLPTLEFSASLIPKAPEDSPASALIFPSSAKHTPFSGWSKSKLALDKKLGDAVRAWRLHDLRRTYASTMQRLGVRLETVERLLNHISGTQAGIVGIYQRHDFKAEKHEAVERYEAFLLKLLSV